MSVFLCMCVSRCHGNRMMTHARSFKGCRPFWFLTLHFCKVKLRKAKLLENWTALSSDDEFEEDGHQLMEIEEEDEDEDTDNNKDWSDWVSKEILGMTPCVRMKRTLSKCEEAKLELWGKPWVSSLNFRPRLLYKQILARSFWVPKVGSWQRLWLGLTTLFASGLENCKTFVSGRAGEAPADLPMHLAGLAMTSVAPGLFISGFFILTFLLNNSSL